MREGRISTLAEVAELRRRLDAEGRRLVLTNGVFDLLHAGHVRCLGEAAALGDALVVAVNSDASARTLKGPGRPVHPAGERAEILLALRAVDRVTVFEEARATAVIEAVRPHVYVKGGDYTLDTLDPEERAALERLGTEIRILPHTEGRSTTAALAGLEAAAGSPPPRERRVAVLGSGAGSNARALLEAERRGELGGRVALVVSDRPGAGILGVAREFGVPALTLDPRTERRGRLSDEALRELLDMLRAASIDLAVLAGFLRILREPLLSAFPDRILNIHPSLLPKHPGRDAVARALAAGDAVSGCTVHLVDEGVDTGRVLGQAEVPVREGDDAATLQARIQEAEHRLYPAVVARTLGALGAGG